jgi:hypothetical protein
VLDKQCGSWASMIVRWRAPVQFSVPLSVMVVELQDRESQSHTRSWLPPLASSRERNSDAKKTSTQRGKLAQHLPH